MKFLVIDDDPVQGDGLCQYFRDHGHHADWVVCLTGALGCMRLVKYDMIIADLHLPCVTPEKLIGGLRSPPQPPMLVVLTASSENDPVLHLLPEGTPIIFKPADPEEILRFLESPDLRSIPGPTITNEPLTPRPGAIR